MSTFPGVHVYENNFFFFLSKAISLVSERFIPGQHKVIFFIIIHVFCQIFLIIMLKLGAKVFFVQKQNKNILYLPTLIVFILYESEAVPGVQGLSEDDVFLGIFRVSTFTKTKR